MPVRPVRWSAGAGADLRRIVEWIAHSAGEERALEILDRLASRVASLSTLASRGRPVPEVATQAEPVMREIIDAPWRIVYVADRERVLVVAILDGRRDVADWLAQRIPEGE